MDQNKKNLLKTYFIKAIRETNLIAKECAVFISFSDGIQRAKVVKSLEGTYEKSFDSALKKMEQQIAKTGEAIKWIKVDWVTEIEQIPYQNFKKEWLSTKFHYYRKGFAFDPHFKLAFLEQEINANAFIFEDKKTKALRINWKNIHYYIHENTGHQLAIDERLLRRVSVFKTHSFFYDGRTFIDLSYEPYFNGQRKCERFNKGTIYEKIDLASQYLSDQIREDGAYDYGKYPYFNRKIDHYNILRHASSTYALIESYEVTQKSTYLPKIDRALQFLMEEAYFEKEMETGERVAYIRELVDLSEIKLGANAAALMALCEHERVTGNKKHRLKMEALANGIVSFYREDGFVHVLDHDANSVLEDFRIIYYEGEAVFALLKYYALTHESKWIDFVNRVFLSFQVKHYEQFADHWLSYASFYLCRESPSKECFEFNLKNAQNILEFASTRETTYATLLELFMATHRLLEWNKTQSTPYLVPEWFDVNQFYDVIHFRVVQGFSGFMYPEVAMYFKAPSEILHAFYIRHHSFRIRIDDVEHSLSGYCQYFHEYDRIRARSKSQ